MKINYKAIITFLITAILFGSIGVYAGAQILAKDISFTSKNENFTATNVEEALDELYENAGKASILSYKGNNDNGTTITVDIGSTIIVSSPASAYATNADKVINSLPGGSFNSIGTYTCVFKATGTSVTITTDNNVAFSYIILK